MTSAKFGNLWLCSTPFSLPYSHTTAIYFWANPQLVLSAQTLSMDCPFFRSATQHAATAELVARKTKRGNVFLTVSVSEEAETSNAEAAACGAAGSPPSRRMRRIRSGQDKWREKLPSLFRACMGRVGCRARRRTEARCGGRQISHSPSEAFRVLGSSSVCRLA